MESKITTFIAAALLALCQLWPGTAGAADKTETLKGTITLGIGGYGLKLDDGKVIRFMGRGGNTVFATCHNGDSCEISGVVEYNTKTPLFLSVTRVRKMKGPAVVPTLESPLPTNTEAAVPAPADQMSDHVTAPTTEPAKPAKAEEDTPATENPSPFLLEDSKGN
jgi:hypothetical protein